MPAAQMTSQHFFAVDEDLRLIGKRALWQSRLLAGNHIVPRVPVDQDLGARLHHGGLAAGVEEALTVPSFTATAEDTILSKLVWY